VSSSSRLFLGGEVLGFELRSLHLLGRHCTVWATAPAHNFTSCTSLSHLINHDSLTIPVPIGRRGEGSLEPGRRAFQAGGIASAKALRPERPGMGDSCFFQDLGGGQSGWSTV
jgi:hypothetical protein